METNKLRMLKESLKQRIAGLGPKKKKAAPPEENVAETGPPTKYQTKEWKEKTKIFEKELEKRRRQRKDRIKKAKRKGVDVHLHFARAGMMIEHTMLSKKLFNIAIVINLFITGWMIYFFATREGYRISTVLLSTVLIWFVLFFVVLFILWLLFYISLDVKIFKRKKTIEEVLPDFLELTSANINAGMTIDKAMWYAIRPKFGVLAKEVETIAKQSMGGVELSEAMRIFSNKYDSKVLRRAVNLLIEGIDAGGEIGNLLHKIASDIKESQLLKKEMAASVTNYTIFIIFAAIIAAPLLMALASQLLDVISSIITSIDLPKSASVPISLSGAGIKSVDFHIFSYLSLGLTALFSAMIVAIIKKGEVKDGIKYIPMFIAISFLIFTILDRIFGFFLGSIF
ncbi:MAG: hypothetical protein GXP63_03445 [DPANN group archaeon]|nr:hypothetical protein [DPANN group archaeon]